MKKAILFANGSYSNKEFYVNLAKENHYIVAVDGGLNFLKEINIKPNLIIGDFDSSKKPEKTEYKGAKILTHPIEKNQTDTELALDYLIKEGFDSFILTGVLGSRTDHSLGNILLLEKYAKRGIKITIRTPKSTMFCLIGPIKKKLHLEKGTTVSLIALTKNVIDLTLKGFYYPLNKFKLQRSQPGRANGNIVEKKKQSIQFKKGSLFVDIENVGE